MTRRVVLAALLTSLVCGSSNAQNLVELFRKAKEEIKSSSWAEAVKTLDQLDAESRKPGMEAQRKQLEPALALYRGVAFANLGQAAEARVQFGAYLATNPNATMDSAIYSKKAIAAMEDARKSIASRDSGAIPSLAGAYKDFRVPASSAGEPPLPEWADGPIRFLLKPDEKKEWVALKDSVSRSDFVEKFWASRDPTPGTPENEARQEFERRVAFADERFGQGEVLGSMTDRGMIFVLLGPPSYAGRKPIETGEDTAEAQGMSTVGRHDATLAMKGGGKSSTSSQNTTADQFSGPGKKVLEASSNWREIWHYRKEILPAGVPYQQVDFEFLTRKGYGENVLQRDSTAVTTMEKAKQTFEVRRPSS